MNVLMPIFTITQSSDAALHALLACCSYLCLLTYIRKKLYTLYRALYAIYQRLFFFFFLI